MKNNIVYGDVHGCFKALKKAIEIAEKENASVIFLGDYVDRGPDSIKTLEYLIEAKNNHPNWVFLRGNHDQMLLDLIEGKAEPNTDGEVLGFGFSNERSTATLNKLKETSLAFQKEVHEFLKNLSLYYENEEYIFVHAILKDSSFPLQEKPKDELIWNYSYKPFWEGKPFIHGHKNVERPVVTQRGININTNCGGGGKLTGLILNPDSKEKQLSYFMISEDGATIEEGVISEG